MYPQLVPITWSLDYRCFYFTKEVNNIDNKYEKINEFTQTLSHIKDDIKKGAEVFKDEARYSAEAMGKAADKAASSLSSGMKVMSDEISHGAQKLKDEFNNMMNNKKE